MALQLQSKHCHKHATIILLHDHQDRGLRLRRVSIQSLAQREKENILANLSIKVEYGEMLKEARSRGAYLTVSDKEHTDIIRMYVEEGLGILAIGERLHRSNRTAFEHIKSHNKAVERSGFCAPCKRAKGQYFNVTVSRAAKKKEEGSSNSLMVTTNSTTMRESKRK